MSSLITQNLVKAAESLAQSRFPAGECIVAALLTGSGTILTSVYSEARVDSASLCAETGSICEAHKLGETVVASICLYRASENENLRVLPACGICQERLAFWGLEVEVAVPCQEPNKPYWQSKTLRELRPYYWNECAD